MITNKLGENVIEVLKFIHDIFERNGIRWVLAGSISLALHGIDVKVGDIDIITDMASALKITQLLKEFQIKELEYSSSDFYRSYHAVFVINDVKVEIMGDLQERIGNDWIDLSWRIDSAEKIELSGRIFPLSPLADQLRSYAGSEREEDREKVGKILEAIRKFTRHS